MILDAPDHNNALEALRLTIAQYGTTAPKFARWMETAILESLTVMHLSPEIRKRLRTTSGLERTFQEIRRRFKTIESFINEASGLRLALAILMEISDEWQFGNTYINIKEEELTTV